MQAVEHIVCPLRPPGSSGAALPLLLSVLQLEPLGVPGFSALSLPIRNPGLSAWAPFLHLILGTLPGTSWEYRRLSLSYSCLPGSTLLYCLRTSALNNFVLYSQFVVLFPARGKPNSITLLWPKKNSTPSSLPFQSLGFFYIKF